MAKLWTSYATKGVRIYERFSWCFKLRPKNRGKASLLDLFPKFWVAGQICSTLKCSSTTAGSQRAWRGEGGELWTGNYYYNCPCFEVPQLLLLLLYILLLWTGHTKGLFIHRTGKFSTGGTTVVIQIIYLETWRIWLWFWYSASLELNLGQGIIPKNLQCLQICFPVIWTQNCLCNVHTNTKPVEYE